MLNLNAEVIEVPFPVNPEKRIIEYGMAAKTTATQTALEVTNDAIQIFFNYRGNGWRINKRVDLPLMCLLTFNHLLALPNAVYGIRIPVIRIDVFGYLLINISAANYYCRRRTTPGKA